MSTAHDAQTRKPCRTRGDDSYCLTHGQETTECEASASSTPAPAHDAQTPAYEVAHDRVHADVWRVERIDYERDGSVEVTIFSGPQAQERAIEYAALKNASLSAPSEQGVDLEAIFTKAVNEIRWMLNESEHRPNTRVETFFDKTGTSEDGTREGRFLPARDALERLWKDREQIATCLRSRLSPGGEATEDEMTEIVTSWAIDHGFVTNASEHVYEDGETEPEIIADLVKRIAARRPVSGGEATDDGKALAVIANAADVLESWSPSHIDRAQDAVHEMAAIMRSYVAARSVSTTPDAPKCAHDVLQAASVCVDCRHVGPELTILCSNCGDVPASGGGVPADAPITPSSALISYPNRIGSDNDEAAWRRFTAANPDLPADKQSYLAFYFGRKSLEGA